MRLMKFFLNRKTRNIEALPVSIAERAVDAPGMILEYSTIANPFDSVMGNDPGGGSRFIRKAVDLDEFRNHWVELPYSELLEILYGQEETEFP